MKRGLSREEAALWSRLAQTVQPMAGRACPDAEVRLASADNGRRWRAGVALAAKTGVSTAPQIGAKSKPRTINSTLDATWDRKLAGGTIPPDFTIDLHGHSLEAAHQRLDHALALALAQGARLVLLITGRPRTADGTNGRNERRGAIRAKFIDWLTHGSHASRIAAIRPAHPRHGGAGAVYVVLKRER